MRLSIWLVCAAVVAGAMAFAHLSRDMGDAAQAVSFAARYCAMGEEARGVLDDSLLRVDPVSIEITCEDGGDDSR